jgi:hypothetical protein
MIKLARCDQPFPFTSRLHYSTDRSLCQEYAVWHWQRRFRLPHTRYVNMNTSTLALRFSDGGLTGTRPSLAFHPRFARPLPERPLGLRR